MCKYLWYQCSAQVRATSLNAKVACKVVRLTLCLERCCMSYIRRRSMAPYHSAVNSSHMIRLFISYSKAGAKLSKILWCKNILFGLTNEIAPLIHVYWMVKVDISVDNPYIVRSSNSICGNLKWTLMWFLTWSVHLWKYINKYAYNLNVVLMTSLTKGHRNWYLLWIR